MNISSMSKSTFQHYYQHFIIPNKHRINILRLTNAFSVDLFFSPPRIIKEFCQLDTLILDNIKSIYLNNLLDHLATLSHLHSLVVIPINEIKNKNTFYPLIFRLPVLKYCKLSFKTSPESKPLPMATKESSSIEHLIIYHDSTLGELGPVLSYVPQLRRLFWHQLSGADGQQADVQGIILKHLTHVSIKLWSVDFDRFEPLIINLFHQLQVLRISTTCESTYLDSDRWERLITSYMPHLRVFDIDYMEDVNTHNDRPLKSSFWREHQWFFGDQYKIFYSKEPFG
jgi:hypothetical protein